MIIEDIPKLRLGDIIVKEDTYYRIEEVRADVYRLSVRSLSSDDSVANWVDYAWFDRAIRIP